MGRNLFCVHSRKRMDDIPELKAEKMVTPVIMSPLCPCMCNAVTACFTAFWFQLTSTGEPVAEAEVEHQCVLCPSLCTA